LLLRFFATVMLIVGLLPSVAFSVTPAAAQDDDTGLINDSTYVSPQFGYEVTWDDPWTTRSRNITSNPGGFDSLTLRDGSNSLRITGRASGDDLQTILDDTIELEIGDATDAEVSSQGGDGLPLQAQISVRNTTVLIEVQELPSTDAIVVIVLTARPDDFQSVLAGTQETVAIDGSPILTGELLGETASTPVVDESIATPEDEPTKTPEDEPTAEVEPTTETTDPDTSGIDGSTYTSPNYGYTLSWDDETWTVPDGGEITDSSQGYDSLRLDGPNGLVYVYAWQGYEGDASSCLEGESDYYETESEGVLDWEIATRANGDPITDADGESWAWGVYNLTYQDPADDNAEPRELTDYIECRELIPGEAILIIFASAERTSYNAHIEDVQSVIDTITIDGDVVDDVTPTPEDIVDETPTPESDSDIPGLDGSLFESPSFGYTIDIPSEFSVVDGTIEDGDETLVLDNGTSTVTIYATDERSFTRSLTRCVTAAAALVEDAYDSFELDETGDGEPFEGSDDDSAYANYVYTNEDGDEYAHFIECSYVDDDESAVIVIIQDVPYDDYASERSARREIENAIDLP